MSSAFTWLDHSEQERRRALDVISLFRYQDTRDELGLASIRDAFADRFFPGTTTIQTRARYFLMVPWLCLDLERKGMPSGKVAQRLRWAEEALIGQLVNSSDTDGVIGREAGKAVKRMPSSIYWAGLKRWGVLAFDGSLAQYHRGLDQFHARVRGHRALSAENREAAAEPTNWHPHVPAPPDDFPASASIKLRPQEAEYLRERILTTCSGTLLAFLADAAESWEPVDFAWEYEGYPRLPAALQRPLEHARAFSEVLHGAAILYNVMLAQVSGSDDWLERHEESFREWARRQRAERQRLSNWDLAAFWKLALEDGARISPQSRKFVEAWTQQVRLAPDPGKLTKDASARRLIQEREVALKKGRARLANPRHLELWNGASGTAQLDFRWGIGQRLLLEIIRALPRRTRGRRVRA